MLTTQDWNRIAVVLSLGAFAGWLTGNVPIGLLVALSAYVMWLHIHMAKLLNWLRNRKEHEPPEVSGIFEDVAHEIDYLRERNKKRKKKLRSYLQQFQQATRALPDATLVLDESDAVKWANSAARETLGIRWPEDVDQRITNLVRNPELIPFLENKKEGASIDIAGPLDASNHLSVRLAPYGKNRWIFVARDISQLHRAHEIRKDFVANVSHELRTPLTVVRGFLETMSDQEEICPPIWEGPFEQMLSHTLRMESLVEDLLMLSKLESGAGLRDPEMVPIPKLITDIQQVAGATEKGKERLFAFELDPELNITGSPKELHSAFSNLIFNAINYTEPRDVIEISWFRDEAGAHFAVKDNGIGIGAEHIPRLTERFYRVGSSRDREQGGTGLGLAIVKHVMNRHGGTLHIESELGKGSVFRCDFPVSRIVEIEKELPEKDKNAS